LRCSLFHAYINVLNSADLLLSAANLRKPTFPATSPTGKSVHFERLEGFFKYPWEFSKSISYGSGFHCISALKYPGYEYAHMSTFLDLGNFCGTLHAYHEGLLREISISRIADSRNKLTHQVLSLPQARDLEFSQRTANVSDVEYHHLEVYEACRLTAMLYTIMVVFPLPRSRHARDYLIPLIRNALDCVAPYTSTQEVRGLYFWCLVVTGVAATGYPVRDWFLRRLPRVTSYLKIESWTEAEKFLEKFAWLRCACNQAGLTFWADAERLRYVVQ
jgi:hypothetical protein